MTTFTSDLRRVQQVSPYAYAGMVTYKRGAMQINITRPEIMSNRVADAVCAHFNLTIDELKEKNRKRTIVKARQIAMYIMHKKGLTLMYVAEFFGKDHTTVIHSECTVKDLMAVDIDYRIEVNEISSAISNESKVKEY